ncbi:MAG: hypothetical protein GY769_17435 [bacterium]|nr:hypothetical protein [bacterium]
MTGELAAEENRSIVRHLVAGCSECGETTSHLWEVLVTGRQAPKPEPDEYEAAFDRAWARAAETHDQLQHEQELAASLCEELLELAPQQQQLRVRNDERFQTLAFSEALIAASERSTWDDAATACHLANLAREITDHLDAGRYGLAMVADARAEAWGTYAGALRVSSDYGGAESALRTARAYLEEGTGRPTEKAKYLNSLAKLLTAKRRTDESLVILTQLEAIYSKLGDFHMVGRVLLDKAFAFGKKRKPEREIELLTRALELLDPARDPRRQLNALHNLVAALIDAGRTDEADRNVIKLRRLYAEQGGRLSLLRFRWLEGRLAYAKSDLYEAERVFTEVRNTFIDLEIGIDAALASLELAEVLWQQGQARQAQERLKEAIPILEALAVHPEALAALAFLEQAVLTQVAGSELIRQTAAFIQRVQRDPTIRFRAADLTAR